MLVDLKMVCEWVSTALAGQSKRWTLEMLKSESL